jgi:putative spermidine/putrescine transport system substrate-binding protein
MKAWYVAPFGALVVGVSVALAVSPVGSEQFNVSPGELDLKTLTPQNFVERVVPLAKKQGSITFYDFTESFTPLFRDNLIPMYAKKYGIEVKYLRVTGDTAIQQLIAAKKANQPMPADVFFMPNGSAKTANDGGVIANLPLTTMLPSAQDLNPRAATVSRGYKHGGVILPFHRNQTAIGYNTRFFQAGTEPSTFAEILEFAKKNPGRFAMTSPAKGGSGSGFLESAILNFAQGAACRDPLDDVGVSADAAKKWAADCMGPVLDYFRQLKPVVEITNGNTDTLNLLANGAAYIGTIWEDQSYDFIGRGLLPQTVKFRLLKSGQVGDGDGLIVTSGTQKLAGALLFADFLMSDEAQLMKLELNGSRSARTKLDASKALKPESIARLLPADQYPALNRARIPDTISDAAVNRFVTELLQN